MAVIQSICFAIAIAACDRNSTHGAAGSSRAQRVTDGETTTPIISVAADALGADRRRNVVADLTLHSESDPEKSFSIVRGVAVDGAQSIYVLDEFSREIRKFAANGRFVKTISRKGHGPGELWEPRAMMISRDTIYVRDDVIERFDTAGAFLGSVSPPLFNLRSVSRIEPVDGKIAMFSLLTSSLSGKDGFDTLTVRLFDSHAGSLTTPIAKALSSRTNIGPVSGPFPLHVAEAIAVSPSGRVFRVISDSFDIEISDVHGSVSNRVVLDDGRIATKSQDIDDDIATRLNILEGLPGFPPNFDTIAFGAALRHMTRPAHRPAIAEMIASPDGSLLLQRYDISDRPYAIKSDNVILWSVLDPAMKPLGNIELPRRFQPFSFTRCNVLGVLRDDDDVASIVRYRIEQNGPGGTMSCN